MMISFLLSPPAMELTTLKASLKRMRSRMGLSQRELAARLGIHQPQVAKAEQGHDLLVSRLQRIAEALECELMLVPKDLAPGIEARLATERTFSTRPHAENREKATSNTEDHPWVETYRREWPDIDPHVFMVIVQIQRAAQMLRQGTERLAAEYGMNAGEIMVLGALRRQGKPYESSLSNLRKQFWISLPGMSKRIRNLERLGFVARVSNPRDRRGALVRLTRKGFDIQEAQVRVATKESAAIREMPPGERLKLSSLLTRVLNTFEARRNPQGSSVRDTARHVRGA